MSEKEGDFKAHGGMKRFIWNPDKKEFCGRNGVSWLKITVFYIIFYLLLAGFWSVMLLIFFQTLDYYKPTWTLESSRIGTNPGLGFRPLPPPENIDSTLIWFTHGSAREWQGWVNSLEEFLKPYEGGDQDGEFVRSCDFETDYEGQDVVCKFVVESLGNTCTTSNNFGYDVGHPCIVIKLNRIYGWKPEGYSNDSFPSHMPESVRLQYDPNYIYITCEGENPADKENIGPIRYYPEGGKIPRFYFPFTNLNGYRSPFVYVHFEEPETGVLINIECRAWAANIKHDRTDRMGSVHFELLVD